jgi:hypothetical protein
VKAAGGFKGVFMVCGSAKRLGEFAGKSGWEYKGIFDERSRERDGVGELGSCGNEKRKAKCGKNTGRVYHGRGSRRCENLEHLT